jgi:hypothetical protein
MVSRSPAVIGDTEIADEEIKYNAKSSRNPKRFYAVSKW